jgi:hypothetical protein
MDLDGVTIAGSSPVAPALSKPLPGKRLGPSEYGVALANVTSGADGVVELERSLALGCGFSGATRRS